MQHDPETYRRYAQECRRMAATLPEEDRRTLLEMSECWRDLARASERERSPCE